MDHMRFKHSFYVLDIDCVINLKALLTYIAERIHFGKPVLRNGVCERKISIVEKKQVFRTWNGLKGTSPTTKLTVSAAWATRSQPG